MILETTQCFLRPLSLADTDLVYALDTLPEVIQYIQKPFSKEASLQHLHQMLMYNKMYNNQLGFWIVCLQSNQQPIGWYTLKHLDRTQEIEIGTRILPDYWHRQYAPEVAIALVEYAWRIGLQKLVSVTHPDNIAPQRILQKIGFQFIQKTFFYNQPVHYFSQTRPKTTNK